MSGSASRAKAYRRRQARGVMMVSLPIDQDDTAALERAGFLTLGQLEDRRAVGEALAQFVRLHLSGL